MLVNWQAVEALGVCTAGFLAFVNVLFFLYYLKIMRDQSEGLSRPVIVVMCSPTLPEDTIHWFEEVIPPELAEGQPKLKNVGNGPALHLKWSYERKAVTMRGESAYLSPSEEFIFPLPVELGVGEKKIECEYESVGRTKYICTTTLRDRIIVKSQIVRK